MPDRLPPWKARSLALAWAVPALLASPLAWGSLAGDGTPARAARVLLLVAASWGVWALLARPIAWVTDRVPPDGPHRARALLVHATAGVAACGIQALGTAGASLAVFVRPASFGTLLATWFFLYLPAGVVVYAAVVAVRTAQRHQLAAVREAERTAALATRLAETQLQALRAQVRPHFIFNALNAAVALVRDRDADRAEDALLALAALLRASLRNDGAQEIPLGEELSLVEHFLVVERLRLGDRLHVERDIGPECLATAVPALLVQSLVENAVRHGFRHVAGPARLGIAAHRRDGLLHVRVHDDGGGIAAGTVEASREGTGLATARARLALLHGERGTLTVGAGPGGTGTVVTLTLPARPCHG